MRYLLYSIFALVLTTAVRADDDVMVPLASSGNWSAMAHQPSVTEQPDVCVAMGVGGLAFRAGGGSVEMHVRNKEWSLPANVIGKIILTIGRTSHVYDVVGNSEDMVAASIDSDAAGPLFDEIASASSLTVQVGKSKPMPISLAGSKTVLTAFRTCAHIGGGTGGGENPFQ